MSLYIMISGVTVAPLAGARIEIVPRLLPVPEISLSLPSRERGLKLYEWYGHSSAGIVAPLAGARIEIGIPTFFSNPSYLSLPSRERGLKSLIVL